VQSIVRSPSTYSYSRYLAAKESVDDRALNQRVWQRFIQDLVERSSPIRILEVGGGVGSTMERILNALTQRGVETVAYTLVDVRPEHVDAARKRLSTWSNQREGGDAHSLRFVTADLLDFAAGADASYDAIVSQAVLDLLPVSETFGALRPLLRERGLWYLPIHFDGVTAFEPTVDAELDAQIERLYHESMAGEEGGRDGAHTGRRLLPRLREAGANLLAAGASDWVVFAGTEGYSADEAYFLHHVLHFVEEELSDHPHLDPDVFTRWIAERRRQIDAGELIYVAHQLDVLAQQAGGRS